MLLRNAYAGGIMSWAAKSVTLGADVNSVQVAAGVHCGDVRRGGGRVETRVVEAAGVTHKLSFRTSCTGGLYKQ
jgi:hypothetical protein